MLKLMFLFLSKNWFDIFKVPQHSDEWHSAEWFVMYLFFYTQCIILLSDKIITQLCVILQSFVFQESHSAECHLVECHSS